MAKPKVSTDWLAACAGCHMSLLDMDERIVALAGLVDIRATPVTDLKEPDESGVDVGVLTGAVNTTTNEEVAHRMRDRCKILQTLLSLISLESRLQALPEIGGTGKPMHRSHGW